jgi:hypothetical protein
VRRRSSASKKSPSEWQPSAKTNYVQLSGFVLLPDDVLPMLANAVVLDYDWADDKRNWKLHKSQSVNLEFWHHDRINALRVVQKLET